MSGTPSQRVVDLLGAGMLQISRALQADRPVIDKTGIDQKFNFHLEYPPDGADTTDDPAAASLFAALGDLGLKLETSKGVREFLVVDHIERPSEN